MPIFRWKGQMEAEKNNTHSSRDAADQQHCHGFLKVIGAFQYERDTSVGKKTDLNFTTTVGWFRNPACTSWEGGSLSH